MNKHKPINSHLHLSQISQITPNKKNKKYERDDDEKKKSNFNNDIANIESGVGSISAYGNIQDLNDEYCDICHIEGDLICCEKCPLVYHAECISLITPNYKNILNKTKFYCSYIPGRKCISKRKPRLLTPELITWSAPIESTNTSVYYQSFTRNEITYSVGSTVSVFLGSLSGQYIAQIDALYSTDGINKCRLRWFYFREQIGSFNSLRSIKLLKVREFSHRELYLSSTVDENTIDVIEDIVAVLPYNVFIKIYPNDKEEDENIDEKDMVPLTPVKNTPKRNKIVKTPVKTPVRKEKVYESNPYPPEFKDLFEDFKPNTIFYSDYFLSLKHSKISPYTSRPLIPPQFHKLKIMPSLIRGLTFDARTVLSSRLLTNTHEDDTDANNLHVEERIIDKGITQVDEIKSVLAINAVLSKPLLGREKEHAKIKNFLYNSVSNSGCSRPLYLAGLPGTGKTASVHQVLREINYGKLKDSFVLIEINCFKLTNPNQLYVFLWRELVTVIRKHYLDVGEKPDSALNTILNLKAGSYIASMSNLDRYFQFVSTKPRPVVVLILDEIDFLMTRGQNVLYNIFNWPSFPCANLTILSISNTLDLINRLLPRVRSRFGFDQISFSPYTYEILEAIIEERLKQVYEQPNPSTGTPFKKKRKFVNLSADDSKKILFEDGTIRYIAKSVSATVGDCRRALAVSTRAVEIAEAEVADTGNQVKVLMMHITQAIKDVYSVGCNDFKSCSLQQKLFLIAFIKESKLKGADSIPLIHVSYILFLLYTQDI